MFIVDIDGVYRGQTRTKLSDERGFQGVVRRAVWDWIVDPEGTVARICSGQKYDLFNADWDDGRWWRIQGDGDTGRLKFAFTGFPLW